MRRLFFCLLFVAFLPLVVAQAQQPSGIKGYEYEVQAFQDGMFHADLRWKDDDGQQGFISFWASLSDQDMKRLQQQFSKKRQPGVAITPSPATGNIPKRVNYFIQGKVGVWLIQSYRGPSIVRIRAEQEDLNVALGYKKYLGKVGLEEIGIIKELPTQVLKQEGADLQTLSNVYDILDSVLEAMLQHGDAFAIDGDRFPQAAALLKGERYTVALKKK